MPAWIPYEHGSYEEYPCSWESEQVGACTTMREVIFYQGHNVVQCFSLRQASSGASDSQNTK